MRRDDHTGRALRMLARYLAVVLPGAGVLAAATGRSALWTVLNATVTILAASLAGAAAGIDASRTAECRALRLGRGDLASRGVSRATLIVGAGLMPAYILRGPSALLLALAVGILCGIAGSRVFLVNRAESAFARALMRLQGGDPDAARDALQEYVSLVEEDPSEDPIGDARRPVVERFLRGESDSLDVPSELQASSTPAGRGTEVSVAEPPEGSGTELVGAREGGGMIGPDGERPPARANREGRAC